jgi:hypothetical protein
MGKRDSRVTGAKSRTGSYGIFAKRLWFTAKGPSVPTVIVWPSGAERATSSLPIMPLPPPRFSTIT